MAFESEHTLRFHHMDRAGMVFHGAYTELFQDAFEDLMRHVGHTEKDLEPELGLRLPVVRHEMTFPAPPAGDGLTIATQVEHLGESSVVFHLVARDATGATCARAEVVRVCIGTDGQPVPIPEVLREAWAPHRASGPRDP